MIQRDKETLRGLLTFAVFAFMAAAIVYLLTERTSDTMVLTQTERDSMAMQQPYPRQHSQQYYASGEQTSATRLFRFDPNTADSTQLEALGFSPSQIRGIYHYRAKGGVYRHAEDLARLYGMTKQQFERLLPYISIGEAYQPADRFYQVAERQETPRDTTRYPQKLKAGERICITKADTTALKKIPGIGSYWARRIAQYRERLGGFYSLDQLADLDDFPVETLEYMQLADGSVRKLRINQLTQNQLRAHPYINAAQAKDIINYRNKRGNISDSGVLSRLPSFGAHDVERLLPYIEF